MIGVLVAGWGDRGNEWGDRIVFVCQGDLWLMGASGKERCRLTATEVREEEPACSPDGEWIAYQVYDAARDVYDLWVMRPDGTEAHTLVSDARDAAWSPDGGRLAFVSPRQGSLDLWLTDRRGKWVRQLTSSPHQEISPTWSPRGEKLAFASLIYQRDETGRPIRCISVLYVRSLAGEEQAILRLEGQEISDLAWSTQDWLAFAVQPFPRKGLAYQIWRVRPDGSDLRNLSGNRKEAEGEPVWAPDGSSLAFTRFVNGRGEVWVMAGDGTARRRLTGLEEDASSPSFLPGKAQRAVKVFVQEKRMFGALAPWVGDREVWLAARDLAMMLGLVLTWQPEKQALKLRGTERTLLINLRHRAAKVNGEPVSLMRYPQLEGGTSWIPVRSVGPHLGWEVIWEPEERTVHLKRLR